MNPRVSSIEKIDFKQFEKRILAWHSQIRRNRQLYGNDLSPTEAAFLDDAESMLGRAKRYIARCALSEFPGRLINHFKSRYETRHFAWNRFAKVIRAIPSRDRCEKIAHELTEKAYKRVGSAMWMKAYRHRPTSERSVTWHNWCHLKGISN